MLSPELRRGLVAQVCCNDEELCEFLDCEVDFLWECQDHCTPRLKYIYTLLGLIEAAQIFSRNKVDLMTKTAVSEMNETYRAEGFHRTDAERDSSGRDCAWSASTSQQFFNRNTQDESIGFSDYRHLYTSEFKNNGYDKSCRHTTGFGFSMSRVDTRHDGDHSLEDIAINTRNSTTNGGTGPYFPPAGLHYNIPGIGFEQVANPVVIGVGFPFPTFRPVITDGVVTPNPVHPPIPLSSEDICPTPTPANPNPECQTDVFPSYGQGWNARYQISISIPIPLTGFSSLSLTWHEGFNERQYMHCSNSVVEASTRRTVEDSDTVTGSTIADEDDNQTYSSEQTDIAHLVRKYGITVRRGITELDGQEISRGRGSGMSHAETQRDKQGTGYQQSRAESETVRHTESISRRNESAKRDQVTKKFGQIGKHLAQVWKRTWDESLRLEREFAARPYLSHMSCDLRSNASCHCPVRRSWIGLNRVLPDSPHGQDTMANHNH